MVEAGIAQHIDLYQTTGGELIMGTGRFVAPKTLEVRLNDSGTGVLVGDKVFLDIGTHAAIPGVPGLEAARVRRTAFIGSFATRAATPWRFASASFNPT